MRGPAAAITLVVFGLFLIWQGLTGNVLKTPMGENILPRWLYIIGGLGLMVLPMMLFLVCSNAGRQMLGL